jgi:hypothetical protein
MSFIIDTKRAGRTLAKWLVSLEVFYFVVSGYYPETFISSVLAPDYSHRW